MGRRFLGRAAETVRGRGGHNVRVEEIERTVAHLEERLRLATESSQRNISEVARRNAGDARGEKREPHLPYLIDLAGLLPSHTVLDVGCGRGRLTGELAGYLGPSGAYHGIEVQERHIRRLHERFRALPNFSFHHVDLANTKYNPGGTGDPAEYRFPLPNDSIDLVVMRSIFTHLLPEQVEHYLAETARVLRPGGRSYITYFLVNEHSRPHLEATFDPAAPGAFPYDHGSYRVRDEDCPGDAVAIDETLVREFYARTGQRVRKAHLGFWPGGGKGLTRQDVVVGEKPAAAAVD
jgi:SAM-dependent methyltransferase